MKEPTGSPGQLHATLIVLAVSLGFWLLVGLVDSTWYYFTALQKVTLVKGVETPQPAPDWVRIFLYNLPYWLIIAVLTLPVVWLTRRFGFLGRRPWRAIAAHTASVVPFAVIHVGLYRFLQVAGAGWPAVRDKLPLAVRAELSMTLDKEILLYVGIVGVVSAVDYYRSYQERARAAAALELEQARLRASLSEARLEALRMQLQPHFLFNALHAISTLILRGDPRSANEMLVRLSDFLRMTLERGEAAIVPLSVELEFLEAYLRIQRVRFGDRLRVVMEIEEPARGAAVPSLILQPLVENAVRHGLAGDPGQGVITIRATVAGGTLALQVADDGSGLRDAEPRARGVGLANVRARLEHLYPGAHCFTLEPASLKGTVATIEIPLRPAPETEVPGEGGPRR